MQKKKNNKKKIYKEKKERNSKSKLDGKDFWNVLCENFNKT